jgi:disulfide bond formation protein DsbB
MTKIQYKKCQHLLVLVTFFVLFASFYFQYAQGMQPCPLCLMQRLCVFLLLASMGIALGTQKKAHWFSFFQLLIAGAGLFFASRQLWLQSLPPESAPACMPGLDVLIQYFPWQTVARALLWGTGDCAESTWSMLGLSMPAWSALYFLSMLLATAFLWIKTRD